MEEWHQKLHNNTSPDDVVICQVGKENFQFSLDLNSSQDTVVFLVIFEFQRPQVPKEAPKIKL